MGDNSEHNSFTGLTFHSTSTYSILEEIGRGGMGIVYLAEKNCEGVTDTVALKTLKTISEKHEEKLRHEANIAAQLRHENIVKTYGLESIPSSALPNEVRNEISSLSFDTARRHKEIKHRRFTPARHKKRKIHFKKNISSIHHAQTQDNKKLLMIVMDYIEGTDCRALLNYLLKKKVLIPCQIVGFIISRIARALAYANEFIIHRDISPENILLNKHGVCKLSDFGVAASNEEEMHLFAGKLCYMSPEQLAREDLDQRSDIFSLGIVAYQLLTGFNPFSIPAGLQFHEQLSMITNRMCKELIPPHLIRQDIPIILSKIVMKMLEFDKAKRYARFEDVCNDLEQRYLYAKGFGPTNNSLSAFLTLIDKGLKNYSQDQLKQLMFLANEKGKISLFRSIKIADFTKEGLAEISQMNWLGIYNIIAKEKMSELS